MKKFTWFKNVYAEGNEPNNEPTGDPTNSQTTSTTTTTTTNAQATIEELLAKARQEEKNKLYPEIEKLKKQYDSAVQIIGDKDRIIADKEKELLERDGKISKLEKDVEKAKSSSDATLVKENGELKTQNEILKKELELKDTQHSEEIAGIKLQSYRDKKIAEAGNAIIPELITGTTEQEIDASIVASKERFTQILASQGIQQVPSVVPSATGAPGAGNAATVFDTKGLSVEDISKMSPEQWREHRKTLGFR